MTEPCVGAEALLPAVGLPPAQILSSSTRVASSHLHPPPTATEQIPGSPLLTAS